MEALGSFLPVAGGTQASVNISDTTTPHPLTRDTPHPTHSPVKVVKMEVNKAHAIQVRNIGCTAAIATTVALIVQLG